MTKPVPVRRNFSLFAILGFATWGCSCRSHATNKPAAPISVVTAGADVKQVAAANTDFGFRMLRQLTEDQSPKNVFFSPTSISSALAMALNGAGGQTERDMAETLGLSAMTQDRINHANGLLLPSLAQPDPKVQVSVANALWVKGVTLSPDFAGHCRRFYAAQAESLDLHSPSAADTINDWVAGNTDGKIAQLVSPADIAAASTVLTNAVYFHGIWQKPFDKNATQSRPFHLDGSVTKTVPLMEQVGEFPYLETSQFQAASLPYGNGRMSLCVLLPKAGQTPEGILRSLDAVTWEKQMGGMKPTRLDLSLPRFRAEYEVRLRGPLSALGMASAFDPSADFQPMGLHSTYISDIIHKAVLEVDEEGTVAAAATGTIMVTASAVGPPKVIMTVDRPFFLAIRDNATGTLLFTGVIRDPE